MASLAIIARVEVRAWGRGYDRCVFRDTLKSLFCILQHLIVIRYSIYRIALISRVKNFANTCF